MNPILKPFLLTVAGALLVGLLKKQQAYLAIALLLLLLLHLGLIWIRTHSWSALLQESFNLITFGTTGFLTEFWGTKNGHWTYHHLANG